MELQTALESPQVFWSVFRGSQFTISLQTFTIPVSQSSPKFSQFVFRLSQSQFHTRPKSFTIRLQSFAIPVSQSVPSFTIRLQSCAILVSQSAPRVSQSVCRVSQSYFIVSQSDFQISQDKFHNPTGKFHNPSCTIQPGSFTIRPGSFAIRRWPLKEYSQLQIRANVANVECLTYSFESAFGRPDASFAAFLESWYPAGVRAVLQGLQGNQGMQGMYPQLYRKVRVWNGTCWALRNLLCASIFGTCWCLKCTLCAAPRIGCLL